MLNIEIIPSMNLSKVSDHDVLTNLERYVKSERKIMHIVLCHIAEVEKRSLYLTLGYKSLYKYLTQHLGYAEDAAYDRMQAARVLNVAPSVTQKTEAILAKLENKTNFETDKVLAIELNQPAKLYQKIKPQSDETIRVELTFKKEDFAMIKEAQDLYSHVVVENDLAKLFTYFVKKAVEHKRGKPQKAANKQASNVIESAANTSINQSTQSFREKPEKPFNSVTKTQRRYISQAIKRAVFAKAHGCCEHVHSETNRRCNSKYQLQVDHVPLAKGGSNAIENLRALCGVHNRLEALRWGLWHPC